MGLVQDKQVLASKAVSIHQVQQDHKHLYNNDELIKSGQLFVPNITCCCVSITSTQQLNELNECSAQRRWFKRDNPLLA